MSDRLINELAINVSEIDTPFYFEGGNSRSEPGRSLRKPIRRRMTRMTFLLSARNQPRPKAQVARQVS